MSSIQGINFSGLASGLDSGAIIDALIRLEKRPITLLEQKKSRLDKQASLYGDLSTKLGKLGDLAKKLRVAGSFIDYKAESDVENKVRLSAGDGAVPGSYRLGITQLARNEVRGSAAHATKDQSIGDGTLQFRFTDSDDDFDVDIGAATGNTLQDIANAINDDADNGGKIEASVIDLGGGNGYELVLTSGIEGEDGSFTVAEDSGFGALNDLAVEITGNVEVAGQNAILTYSGVQVERSTNKVDDLIPGVTIDLIGATDPGQELQVTVSTDPSKVADKIQEFVDAYNEIVDFVNAQMKVKVEQSTTGGDETQVQSQPLLGDSTLLSIQRALRDIVGGAFPTGNEAYGLLSQVGIEADREGKLTFERSGFEAAVTDDHAAVRDLFTLSGIGVADRVWNRIDDFTDSVDGIIKARTEGIGRTKKDIDNQIERLEARVEKTEQNLRRRFASLEELIGSLEAQRGSLSSFFQSGK
ncbi:MAG: flagellar filament capping protein FliD [Planctomycetota bacterium]